MYVLAFERRVLAKSSGKSSRTPNAAITARASQTGTGNYKIVTAFVYFAVTAMYLALNALAGAQFNAVVWVLPLVIPMAMGITGWNIGRPLTADEERQQSDISRWDL